MPKKRKPSKRIAEPAARTAKSARPGVPPGQAPASAPALPPASTDRFTYRELRNTPGRVWERLESSEPLTLVADGVVKAVLIPVPDGDAESALRAYRRGRALEAMREIQAEARRNGTDKMTLDEINEIIRAVRRERAAQDE